MTMVLAADNHRRVAVLAAALLALLPPTDTVRAADGAAPAPDAVDAAGDPPFDIWEYRVQGNTLLPPLVIERAVYPLLGPGKRLADVEQARAAVEQAFRDAGYATAFVDIPEQQVTGGLVRLAVTEGRVATVRVTGTRYFSNGWIRDQVPEVQPGQVPRLAVFQDELRQLGARSSNRQITPVLRPGREAGTVDVELKVEDRLPLNGSLEVNNRAVPNTTSTRVNANVSYDNLWQRDHSIALQYQVAPEDPDETEVFAVSYVLRPKASPVTYAFYGVKSDSDIAVQAGGLNVIGKGTIIGGRAIIPLPSAAAFFQGLTLGVDYKDFDENIRFGGDPDDPDDVVTPISYLNWSSTWNGTWVGEASTQSIELALNVGLRDVANGSDEFADRRFKGRPNYVYLTAGYDLSRPLPWWGTSMYLGLSGQLTPQPLVPNEQFNVGGLDTLRGYYESEVLADYGLQATGEWRGPNWGQRLWSRLDSLYGYTFLDWATLQSLNVLSGQDNSATLYSSGVGLRLKAAAVTASLDWALPLKAGAVTEARDDRLLFLMRMDFR
jgi:hemolysin activation/secretion protein